LYNALGAKIYIENDKKLKEAIYKYTNTEKVNILELAMQYHPYHPQDIIGIRSGETLSEELMTQEEESRAIKKGKFYIY